MKMQAASKGRLYGIFQAFHLHWLEICMGCLVFLGDEEPRELQEVTSNFAKGRHRYWRFVSWYIYISCDDHYSKTNPKSGTRVDDKFAINLLTPAPFPMG